jgi:prepilin-type N-terminal cleavage/methylation domain-containing protein
MSVKNKGFSLVEIMVVAGLIGAIQREMSELDQFLPLQN